MASHISWLQGIMVCVYIPDQNSEKEVPVALYQLTRDATIFSTFSKRNKLLLIFGSLSRLREFCGGAQYQKKKASTSASFTLNHVSNMLPSAAQQVQVHPHLTMALNNPLWSGAVEALAVWITELASSDIALEGETDGDLILGAMGQGLECYARGVTEL